MRAVVPVEYGVLEINFMWLPTCIGMNAMLKSEMEKALAEKFKGAHLDDVTLDKAHDAVVDFLEQKLPEIQGLSRYLDAMKYLELRQ